MKISSLMVLGLAGLSVAALADDSAKIKTPWLLRVRALELVPANQSVAFSAAGTNFPTNAISLNTKTFPEFDVSYFFTKNIATELVLTYPQQQDVYLAGAGKIGTLTHLPPSLLFQYHYPIDKCPVTPYAGVGFNYTRITATNLNAAGIPLDLNRDSFGLAYGVGLDYNLNDRWVVNLDFKHVTINSSVVVQGTGALVTNVGVNPNLYSFGVGYRF